MKKKKLSLPRRKWHLNPTTRVVPDKKKYVRARAKRAHDGIADMTGLEPVG